jgi:plastocyanin
MTPDRKEGLMNVRRLPLVLALAAGLTFVLLPTVPAHAGAGCHNAKIRDVAGTHVDLKDSCFVQTILRVQPGQAVTWTNRDGTEHAVTGVGGTWGDYTTFLNGRSVTYRFSRAGIFPYFCYVHPGMVGAIVVGNGGKATSTQSADGSVVPVLSPIPPRSDTGSVPAADAPVNPVASSSSADPWRTVALVTLGLLAAVAAGVGARRLGVRRSHARAGVS